MAGEAAANNEPKCDHICLKDDGHVDRGEPHFYGYEIPSPRRSDPDSVTVSRADLGAVLDAVCMCDACDHASDRRTPTCRTGGENVRTKEQIIRDALAETAQELAESLDDLRGECIGNDIADSIVTDLHDAAIKAWDAANALGDADD